MPDTTPVTIHLVEDAENRVFPIVTDDHALAERAFEVMKLIGDGCSLITVTVQTPEQIEAKLAGMAQFARSVAADNEGDDDQRAVEIRDGLTRLGL